MMSECLIRDIKINYEVFGSGKPIIMIHGFSPDSRLMIGCMEPIFKEREGFKRIYLDLPGMGKTKNYQSIKNSNDMLEIVIDFIEAIIPNQSFLVVGESYGSYLARGIIAKSKEKIAGAAFICPMIIPEMGKRNLPEHLIIFKDENFLEKLNKEERDAFSSNSVVLNEYTWQRYKNEILIGCEIADENFLSKIKEKYSFTFEIDNILFESPSVFLLGKQDYVVGYKDAFELLDKYPRATFAVLDKAGHNLQIEQQTLFNSLINEWLDRVTENK